MLRPLVRVLIPALIAGVLSLPPAPVAAQSCPMVVPPVGDPFPDCSSQQVFSILPPGNNGLTNAFDEATKTQEPHATDQQGMYASLKNVAPNLQAADIQKYYKDAGFTVAAGDIERQTTFPAPHDGTVILWDRFGVPHVYGKTRADTEFGAGYAAARDRLFVMDVLRHIGRSRLSQFIGPSPFAFQEDCTIAQVAGYSEQELTYQANLLPQRYTTPFGSSTEGRQVVDDGTNYVTGVNAYIDAAKLDLTLMPVEYAALPAGQTVPQHWSPADIVAVAAIVQSIFAVGGGDEVDSWFLYKALVDKFGSSKGFQIWHDLRLQNDAGAPTTLAQPFPYMNSSNSDSTTLPGIADLTSRLTDAAHYVCSSVPTAGPAPPAAPSISLNLPQLAPGHMPAMSNALLVDAAHSASGHPIAVFGPQVGYFIPEILHEEDLHGPGLHARGAAFPGTDIYVELGHGTHYAWSATSAGSDLIDQRLELICDPATPTIYTPGPVNGQYYWYESSCTRHMYERTDTEQALPSPAAGPYPPTVITFHIERTIHGPVIGRGTAQLSPYGAVPVAISVERSTWFDELGAAPAFLEWNDPDIIHGARDFMGAAAKETGTFNWFYADANDIAYYSSGRLPQRSTMVNPNFISWGTTPGYEWQGFQVADCIGGSIVTPTGPDSTKASTSGATTTDCGYAADWLTADGSAQDPHPHAINPPSGFLTNWNNKPAPEWSAADSNFGFGSIYRVMSLTDRVQATLASGPATPVVIINDMEDAGSVDLDGSKLVPPMLAVLGPGGKPDERQVISILASWVQQDDLGAHRRESASDPSSYQQGNAVAIMDTLYPNLVHAIFDPWLGDHHASGNLYPRVFALKALSNPPGQLGSAYDESSGGWESYVNTALRQVSGQPINDAYSQLYCGSTNGSPGNLGRCRDALRDALDTTIAQLTEAYRSSDPARWTCNTNNNSPGQCNPKNDYIIFQPVGAQKTDPMHWINRPTFQQVVQFPLP